MARKASRSIIRVSIRPSLGTSISSSSNMNTKSAQSSSMMRSYQKSSKWPKFMTSTASRNSSRVGILRNYSEDRFQFTNKHLTKTEDGNELQTPSGDITDCQLWAFPATESQETITDSRHRLQTRNQKHRARSKKNERKSFCNGCCPCPFACACACLLAGLLLAIIAAVIVGVLLRPTWTTTTAMTTLGSTATTTPTTISISTAITVPATNTTATISISTSVLTTAVITVTTTTDSTTSTTTDTVATTTTTDTATIITTTTISIITTTVSTSTTTKTTTTTTATVSVGNWSTTGTSVIGAGAGTGANQLNNLWGLVFDSSDNLYIADRFNHRIQKLAPNASAATTVAGQATAVLGSANTHLNEPTNIQLDQNDNLYIADMKNHRIQFWPKNATSGITVAGVSGVAGSANNQLDSPYGLALDKTTGTLYIADYSNHRIMRYLFGASSGTVVAGGNGAGTANTQTNLPVGVIYESATNSLAIINTGTHNIVRWVLGGSSWTLLAGSPAGVGTAGSTSTTLNTPEGITFDPMGNLYVADRLNHRVQFFLVGQLTGRTVAGTTGVSGSTATLLNNPYAVALDSNLNLYVADRVNNRILKYPRI